MSLHAARVRQSVETGVDASAVTASWRRCLKVYGLDPDLAVAPVPDHAALAAARTREAALLDIAGPYLDRLYGLLADSDCGVLLADRTGLTLDLRTNRDADTWGRRPEDWLGTRYCEEMLGTNSLGTCLAEQRGVIIRGEQHFLTRYTDRAGIAVPLFGPDGNLAGALNLNQNAEAHDARLDTFFSISLANFARQIETELFARAHPETRLMLASPAGRRPDALLAVDDDDRVVGATRSARRLLELGDDAIASAPSVTELYETSAPRNDVLADVERRTIARALARCGGNLSAAARVIGISRSTLYRKLKSYGETDQPWPHATDSGARQTSPLGLKSSSRLIRFDRPSRTSR